jgi:hypothetical protein
MSFSEEFLAGAVAGAQHLLDGHQITQWKGVVLDLSLADQLAPKHVLGLSRESCLAQI